MLNPTPLLGRAVHHLVPPGLTGFLEFQNYKHRVHQGQHPLVAGSIAGARFAAGMLLSVAAFTAIDFGPQAVMLIGGMATHKFNDHNNLVRQMKTPFSHRFEHTEVTSRAQMLALQSMGAAWGHAAMGSEASRMAARYGRGG